MEVGEGLLTVRGGQEHTFNRSTPILDLISLYKGEVGGKKDHAFIATFGSSYPVHGEHRLGRISRLSHVCRQVARITYETLADKQL